LNTKNFNISNIIPILANSGLSPQELLNIVKNNNNTNDISNLNQEKDQQNEKNEINNQLDKNFKKNYENKGDVIKKYKISPIDSNNASDGEESSENERFFMLDKKVEKNDSVSKININSQINNNQNQIEPILKNVNTDINNNPILLNFFMNNDNLINALHKIKEKAEIQNLSLVNSVLESNFKIENQNINDKINLNSNLKNLNMNPTSILKDLGEDKPKDPRRKKKESKF